MLLFFFFIKSGKKKVSNYLYLSSVVLLILFIGLRGSNIGDDTPVYFQSFDLRLYEDTVAYEASWIFICTVVNNVLHGDFQVVLLIYSTLTILPLAFVCYKRSPYPLFSLFLFLFLGYAFHSMNIMRQSVAMSFSILVIYELENKKYIYAIISYLIAIVFHLSAIIIGPLLLLVVFLEKKSTNFQIILIIISLMIGFLFYSQINEVLGYISYEKYQNYSRYSDTRGANIQHLFVIYAINAVFTAFFLSVKKSNSFFISAYAASCVLTNFVGYNIGFNRIIYYISISAIVALPEILKSINISRGLFFVLKTPLPLSYILVRIVLIVFSIYKNSEGVFNNQI
jgi:hypothetical protein